MPPSPPNTNRRSTPQCLVTHKVLGCDTRASNVTQRQRMWVMGKGKHINGATKGLGKCQEAEMLQVRDLFTQISGFPLICSFSRGDGGKGSYTEDPDSVPMHTARGQAKSEIRQQGGPKRGEG